MKKMRLVYINPDKLLPFDKNPRKNDHAVDAVAKSIETFGFNCPIVIDRKNRICAGHTRWKAAQKLNLKAVPKIIADDLTGRKFTEFNITDNQTGLLSRWDEVILKTVIVRDERLWYRP